MWTRARRMQREEWLINDCLANEWRSRRNLSSWWFLNENHVPSLSSQILSTPWTHYSEPSSSWEILRVSRLPSHAVPQLSLQLLLAIPKSWITHGFRAYTYWRIRVQLQWRRFGFIVAAHNRRSEKGSIGLWNRHSRTAFLVMFGYYFLVKCNVLSLFLPGIFHFFNLDRIHLCHFKIE